MKHLDQAVFIPAHEFKIIDNSSQVLITKKQKYELILWNGSTFKRVKNTSLCSFQNRDDSIKQVYICSRERIGCRCMFVLSHDGNGRVIGTHETSLQHSVDIYRSARYEFKCHVIKCLSNSKNELPFNIINSYMKEFDINEYSPCLNYMSSCICKEKQKGLGTLPQTFDELDLNKMKEVGESFEIEHIVYFDNQTQKNILLIYNPWQLEVSRTSTFFLSDATFRNVPKMFSQLLIIHALIGPQSFPVYFILCQSKSEVMYTKVFSRLRELGVKMTTCMVDLEVSQRNGLRNSFEGIKVVHCLFHWLQCLIRHVKKESLGTAYSSDKEVNSLIHLYFSLPFIQTNELNSYLEIIQNEIQSIQDVDTRTKCLKFNQYFHDTWIHGVNYTPDDWNQCGEVSVLTNNWSEGFNSGFAKRFARSHPNPFTLIETLNNVMKYYQFLRQDIMRYRGKYKFTNYSKYHQEIIAIQSEKETLFKNEKKAYMVALGNVPLRLIIKQQMEFYEENNINKIEVKKMKEMIEGKRDLSIIVDESDEIELKIKHKKLAIVTKYLNKKRQEYVNSITKKGIKMKRRPAVDMVLNEDEKMQLSDELNSVNAESVSNDKLSNYCNDIQNISPPDEDILNEFDDGNDLAFSVINRVDNSMINVVPNDIEVNENQLNEENENDEQKMIEEETMKESENNGTTEIQEVLSKSKTRRKNKKENKNQTETKPSSKKKSRKNTIVQRMNKNTKKELRMIQKEKQDEEMSEDSD